MCVFVFVFIFFVSICLGHCHHQMISFRKIYSLNGLKHHSMEINGDDYRSSLYIWFWKIKILLWKKNLCPSLFFSPILSNPQSHEIKHHMDTTKRRDNKLTEQGLKILADPHFTSKKFFVILHVPRCSTVVSAVTAALFVAFCSQPNGGLEIGRQRSSSQRNWWFLGLRGPLRIPLITVVRCPLSPPVVCNKNSRI